MGILKYFSMAAFAYVAFIIRSRTAYPDIPDIPTLLLSDNSLIDAREQCQVIHGSFGDRKVKFCEDNVMWEDADIGLISCDSGRGEWNTVMGPLKNPNPKGQLWLYRADAEVQDKLVPIEIEDFPDHDFHPLGINVWTTEKSSTTKKGKLYIVNHAREQSVLEVADVEYDSLTATFRAKYLRTVAHDNLDTPNSVYPIADDLLLMTNDHTINRRRWPGLLHVVESMTTYPGGSVVKADLSSPAGVEIKTVVPKIPFANGIAMSPSKQLLAVSSSSGTRVYIYRVEPDGMLSYHETIYLKYGAPDNLSWRHNSDEFENKQTETLFVTGHPHFPSLVKLSRNPHGSREQVHAPSVVFGITFRHNGPGNIKSDPPRFIFRDHGTFFGSSTTTTVDAKRKSLVVSGLYEEGILECKNVDV